MASFWAMQEMSLDGPASRQTSSPPTVTIDLSHAADSPQEHVLIERKPVLKTTRTEPLVVPPSPQPPSSMWYTSWLDFSWLWSPDPAKNKSSLPPEPV